MDLQLPGVSGIDAMMAIRVEFPNARVIILTTFDGDVEAQRALQAGACSYFLKTTPPKELVETIRQVHAAPKIGRMLWPSRISAGSSGLILMFPETRPEPPGLQLAEALLPTTA